MKNDPMTAAQATHPEATAEAEIAQPQVDSVAASGDGELGDEQLESVSGGLSKSDYLTSSDREYAPW